MSKAICLRKSRNITVQLIVELLLKMYDKLSEFKLSNFNYRARPRVETISNFRFAEGLWTPFKYGCLPWQHIQSQLLVGIGGQ